MSTVDAELPCTNCRPEPHAFSIHHGEGGPCGHPGCPCFRFVPAPYRPPLTSLSWCYICGKPDHVAGPKCPYWRPVDQR